MEKWQFITLMLAVFSLWFFFYGMRLPKPYRHRQCMGKEWKRKYPSNDNNEIRLFLTCFVDGMAFDDKEKLKFNPDDKVIDVYRSIYGGKTPFGDAMECETFAENLSQEFNVSLDEIVNIWEENTTLGELFNYVTNK